MLIICNNYVNTIRFKGNGLLDYPNDFNFRLNSKIGIRNDNRHKRFSYFEKAKRFDKKLNKIAYHDFTVKYAKKYKKVSK